MYLNYFCQFNRFMADHEAWRELAEIYVSLQMLDFILLFIFPSASVTIILLIINLPLFFPAFCPLVRYKQAAFCYEELILTQPTVPLFHLAYADVSNFFMKCDYFILVKSNSSLISLFQ